MFKNNNFIENSIIGVISFFKESIFSDEYALKKGFLQALEPRLKSSGFLIFLILVLLLKNALLLFCLYLLCLVLVYSSRINLGFFLKRTWIFIPLFSFFIAIPALFSNFTPGEPLFSFNLFGIGLIISKPGFNSAVLFVSRVVTSVSFAVLLSLTTRHNELLSVLRIFKIPQVFVMTLGMCYRYIYLFAQTVENTYLGIKSRVGTNIHYKKGQHIVAGKIAVLWQKSSKLNEEVYNAMLSRGFTGEPVVLDQFRINTKDWAWLVFSAGVFTLLICLNHAPR